MATVHVMISGKVQGVFFRATAKEKATDLGLSGWVKNTAAGQVEATVSGTPDAIENFIDWCHQGPPRAQVTSVEVTPKPDSGLTGFEVIR